MQVEIADVLEPLYRAGEEWEKLRRDLRGAAGSPDRRRASGRRCCGGWPRSPSTSWSIRSRRSGGGPRRSRKIRRRSRRSTSCCGWRARPTSGTPYVTTMSGAASPDHAAGRCGATCCCGWPPASRTTSAIWSAPRSALVQVLERARRRTPAALASLDRIYESQGMYENLAAVLRQRLTITDDSAELVALHLRLGRVYAEALDERRSGAIASYLAVLEQDVAVARGARRARAALLPQRALDRSCTASTRRCVDVTKDDDGLADCYARMAKLAADALDDREQGRRAVGPRRRHPRRGRHRAVGPGRSARDGRRVERADRGPGEAGPSRRPIPRRASRSTSAWAASGARS